MSFVNVQSMYSSKASSPSNSVVPKTPVYKTPPYLRDNNNRKDDDDDARNEAKESLVDYSEHATMHGIYYVFERIGTWYSRLFWTIVCIALFVVCVILIVHAYNQWKENPVLTSVATTAMPIEEIDFPAITICGLGSIQTLQNAAFIKQVLAYLEESKIKVNDSDIFNPIGGLDLLKKYDTTGTFITNLYPGATLNPDYLAQFVATQDPSAELRAAGVVSGGNIDPCANVAPTWSTWTSTTASSSSTNSGPTTTPTTTSTSTTTTGTSGPGSGSTSCQYGSYSPASGRCFSFSGDTYDSTNYWSACETVGGFHGIYFSSDVNGLKELFDQGDVSYGYGDKLWVANTKNQEIFVDYNNNEMNSSTFGNWTTTFSYDSTRACMAVGYDYSSRKVLAFDEPCVNKHRTVCYSFPGSTPGSTHGDCTTTKKRRRRSTTTTQNKLDNLLNPTSRQKLDLQVAKLKAQLRDSFNKMDIQKAYKSMFELLWYSQLPCFDVQGFSTYNNQYGLLKKCIWKGKIIPCSAIFKAFPTDRGMCCTFNMKAADEEFEKGVFVDSITKLHKRDANKSYEGTDLPDDYIKNKEPKSKPGKNRGLTVILDAHTDQLQSSSVDQDFQGFFAVVDSPSSYPLVNSKSILLRPGHENLVAMSPTKIVGTKALRNIKVNDRKCYFRDETEAKSHVTLTKEYSEGSCQLECEIKSAQKLMLGSGKPSCVPWYLPTHNVANQSVMCDPWDARDFRKFQGLRPDGTCSHCLADCETIYYRTSVTAVPFRPCDNKNLGVSYLCNLDSYFTKSELPDPPIFAHAVALEYDAKIPSYAGYLRSNMRKFVNKSDDEVFKVASGKDEYDAYQRDIAIATFYFDSSTAFQYARAPRMTWIDFLSQVGGLMGLCLGFSFASGIEIFYWFGCRLWIQKCCKTTKKSK